MVPRRFSVGPIGLSMTSLFEREDQVPWTDVGSFRYVLRSYPLLPYREVSVLRWLRYCRSTGSHLRSARALLMLPAAEVEAGRGLVLEYATALDASIPEKRRDR